MTPKSISAQTRLEHELRQLVTDAFKFLFENNHLYQSFRVETEPVISRMTKELAPNLPAYYSALVQGAWQPSDPSDRNPGLLGTGLAELVFDFKSPDVKLFCARCDGVEAFNNVSSKIIVHHVQPISPDIPSFVLALQVFVFTFLCQSCKSIPEAFLVRREGNKLTLSGRSPIEHVNVPKIIPKSIQKYFSDAIVAYQSGQALAANFMLRTLIEQWSYSQAGSGITTADQAIDAYMNALPPDFNSRFPSLRDVYSDLSIDLHSATGSADLFDSCISKITEHFDARRLFKITGK